jgi:hypothetical protein
METTKAAGSTLLNKIIIPVITTVLGASAIYFLGFNKKISASAAEIEKTTVNAWQAFVSANNINYKVTKSISEEYYEKIRAVREFKEYAPVFRDFKDELFKESDKLVGDIEIILKKSDDIDEGFVSMMKRTLDNMKAEREKTAEFVDNLIALAKSDRDDAEKREKWQRELDRFNAMGKNMVNRQVTEAEDIAAALSKKYNRPFDLNELLLYADYKKEKDVKVPDNRIITPDKVELAPVDPTKGTEYKENPQDDNKPLADDNANNEKQPTTALLTGEWQMKGGALELSKNGDMFWTIDNKGYIYGDWELIAGKLQMHGTNPNTKVTTLMLGFFSDFTGDSFTLTLMSTPREVYYFKRSK